MADRLANLTQQSVAIACNPRYSRPISYLLLIFDVTLSILIIKKVPYTEIDWEAYMQQIEIFRSGERNYANIKGGTGPLVYPAGHVYIFNFLYSISNRGQDRRVVEAVFLGVYILSLWMTMKSYRLAKSPPWIFPLLVLSKRLHSIYLLRFFNDCFSVFFMLISTFLLQRRAYTLSAILYTLSISVKMSSLLYLPAFGLILFLAAGSRKALRLAALMAQIQVALSLPFITGQRSNLQSYVGKAFEFSRVFLWKWTINWRFAGREVFESAWFKYTLLFSHVALLVSFMYTRWIRPAKRTIPSLITLVYNPNSATPAETEAISRSISPQYMLTTLLTCNVIGMLCARSLHYQFHSWMAWGTPFLLWKSHLGPAFVVPVWVLQEYAWNVYPSTPASSMIAVTCIALQILGVWWGTKNNYQDKIKLHGR